MSTTDAEMSTANTLEARNVVPHLLVSGSMDPALSIRKATATIGLQLQTSASMPTTTTCQAAMVDQVALMEAALGRH